MRLWSMAKYAGQETLGDIFYKRRRELGYTIKYLSQETKILPKYLEALETNNYVAFSSTAHAKGFLKIYALALGLDSEKILAVYRRDIVVQTSNRTPEVAAEQGETTETVTNPNWKTKLILNRKQLALAGGVFAVLFVILSIFAGLSSVFQAPSLSITEPIRLDGAFNGSIDINTRSIRFQGTTAPQTVVRLNGTPLSVRSDNTFVTDEIPLAQENTIFTLIATNQFGRTTEITLQVTRTLPENAEPQTF